MQFHVVALKIMFRMTNKIRIETAKSYIHTMRGKLRARDNDNVLETRDALIYLLQ